MYILLFCFWEGDSYLIDGEYIACSNELGKLTELAEQKISESMREATNPDWQRPRLYLPGEEYPGEDEGQYGSPSFYRIFEDKIL